jgi:hypothetical protein
VGALRTPEPIKFMQNVNWGEVNRLYTSAQKAAALKT